jgi:chemotaxis protein methyltransferase CheR
MSDGEFAAFLGAVSPRLGLRAAGYRRVGGSVRKRVKRRIEALGLASLAEYRLYLEGHPEEWAWLERCSRITISRFARDGHVFAALVETHLPALAAAAQAAGRRSLRMWSAGAASGEEAYSLAIAFWSLLAPRFERLTLEVLGTDVDEDVLARAERAVYGSGSLRELPEPLRAVAFERRGDEWCLRPTFRAGVRFEQRDVRAEPPSGSFDLIACRNLAFSYFDDRTQRRVSSALIAALHMGGLLVVGEGEAVPEGVTGVAARGPCVYARVG